MTDQQPDPRPRSSIADVVSPQQDYLLVRRHTHSRQVGVGEGGRPLVAPDTAADLQPCRSGVVLKAGPYASYEPGTVIAFGNFAMTVLEHETGIPGKSEDVAIGLVASTDVLCRFATEIARDDDERNGERNGETGPEVLPAAPLSLPGARFARAPRGMLLVERSALPGARGRILLAGTYSGSVQSLEATIVDTGDSFEIQGINHAGEQVTDRYFVGSDSLSRAPRVGDLILMSQHSGRPIPFGINRDRVLWSIPPAQIMCFLDHPPATAIHGVPYDYDPRQHYRGPAHGPDALGGVVFDEGDPRGPR